MRTDGNSILVAEGLPVMTQLLTYHHLRIYKTVYFITLQGAQLYLSNVHEKRALQSMKQNLKFIFILVSYKQQPLSMLHM